MGGGYFSSITPPTSAREKFVWLARLYRDPSQHLRPSLPRLPPTPPSHLPPSPGLAPYTSLPQPGSPHVSSSSLPSLSLPQDLLCREVPEKARSEVMCPAHHHELSCLALNQQGTLVATSSSKVGGARGGAVLVGYTSARCNVYMYMYAPMYMYVHVSMYMYAQYTGMNITRRMQHIVGRA